MKRWNIHKAFRAYNSSKLCY